jgi:hypothetical protein
MSQLGPDDFPALWAAAQATGKPQPLSAKQFDCREGRPGPTEGREEEPNTLLHLLIGIENDPTSRIIGQADGQGQN